MPAEDNGTPPDRASSGAAGARAAAAASPGPLQPGVLIAAMQRTQSSWTQGYDVVSILAADRVNELFAQQYVIWAAADAGFAPVNGKAQIAGNLEAVFTDVRLGPPLISFSPGAAEPQDADLRVEFMSGTVTIQQVQNDVTTILSTQHVTLGSGFALTGVVPLADVQGENDPKTHEVRLDVANACDFAAHLNISGDAARTALGKYFLGLMQKDAGSWAYVLGSLNYSSSTSMKLVPFSFKIATQVDAANPADKGRVLLFITTAYSAAAPPGQPAAMELLNMVPAQFTSTLIVANRVLVAGMVLDSVLTQLASAQATALAKPVDPDMPEPLYAATVTGGSINLGTFTIQPTWYSGVYHTARTSSSQSGLPITPEDVVVPLAGIALSAGGTGGSTGLNTTAQLSWPQSWTKPVGVGTKQGATGGLLSMTLGMSGLQVATVDPADGTTFRFGSPPPASVSFTPEGVAWYDSSQTATAAGGAIADKVQPLLQKGLSIQLPDVKTFAVDNLLFPGHNIQFSSANVPGDLVAFGDLAASAITVAPLYATLTPGQTCKFSAIGAGGSAVHWSVRDGDAGRIEADGTYTAPDTISDPPHEVVTAKASVGGTPQTASAVVTLVPPGLSVSPDYAVITTDAAAQQFVASAAGQLAAGVHWSLVGPPSSGTITADGLYTPPGRLQAWQAVTVRATSADGVTADALLIVTPNSPQGVRVGPPVPAGPLAAGKSAQLTAADGDSANANPLSAAWSVLPAIGTVTPISPSGGKSSTCRYTAPATVTTATTVAVIADVYSTYAFGLAPLRIVPSQPPPGPV
jgi:hypothetical protein